MGELADIRSSTTLSGRRSCPLKRSVFLHTKNWIDGITSLMGVKVENMIGMPTL